MQHFLTYPLSAFFDYYILDISLFLFFIFSLYPLHPLSDILSSRTPQCECQLYGAVSLKKCLLCPHDFWQTDNFLLQKTRVLTTENSWNSNESGTKQGFRQGMGGKEKIKLFPFINFSVLSYFLFMSILVSLLLWDAERKFWKSLLICECMSVAAGHLLLLYQTQWSKLPVLKIEQSCLCELSHGLASPTEEASLRVGGSHHRE